MPKDFDFTLGADPEMNITMGGRRIMAQNTIQGLFRGDKNFPEKSMGFQVKKFGEVGWDGNNPTGEIRPTPAKNPAELVANIKGIFQAFHDKAPLFDLSTLSYFGSIGGHIHFGLPKEFADTTKIRGIHKKMASFYLPIMLSENKINLQLRIKTGYGTLTDHRGQNYGGSPIYNGYEFRTPSAEWLTTEKIALATLAYVGTVYNEIINHPNKMKKYTDIFYKTDSQANALQELALSDYKTLTKGLYERIRKIVRTFEFYPQYKDEIEYILNPEKVMKDKVKVEYNIITGWGMKSLGDNKISVKKRDLVNKKKIKNLAAKYNLDILSRLVNIAYNDDTNVGMFAKALAERITIFNWRLKNSYHLFGLKKGIKGFLCFDSENNLLMGEDMIKTTGDLKETKSLMFKMIEKFKYNGNGFETSDPEKEMIYGKKNVVNKKAIIVGIPYDIRLDNDINPLVSTIYKLEGNKLRPQSLETFLLAPLREDLVSAKNAEGEANVEPGEIHGAMVGTPSTAAVVFDTSSRSRETPYAAIDLIRNEEVLEREAINEEPEEQGPQPDPTIEATREALVSLDVDPSTARDFLRPDEGTNTST